MVGNVLQVHAGQVRGCGVTCRRARYNGTAASVHLRVQLLLLCTTNAMGDTLHRRSVPECMGLGPCTRPCNTSALSPVAWSAHAISSARAACSSCRACSLPVCLCIRIVRRVSGTCGIGTGWAPCAGLRFAGRCCCRLGLNRGLPRRPVSCSLPYRPHLIDVVGLFTPLSRCSNELAVGGCLVGWCGVGSGELRSSVVGATLVTDCSRATPLVPEAWSSPAISETPAGWSGGVGRCPCCTMPNGLPTGWSGGVGRCPCCIMPNGLPTGWPGGVGRCTCCTMPGGLPACSVPASSPSMHSSKEDGKKLGGGGEAPGSVKAAVLQVAVLQ
ncbi:hypothetical protein V8C86DRAFT_2587554 [Haematococcus lacustris]